MGFPTRATRWSRATAPTCTSPAWNDDTIAIFARDAGTGLLTFVGTEGSGQARQIVPSPDGAYLYVRSATEYLSTFARNAMTGLLTLVDSREFEGGALAISADGTSIYHYVYPSGVVVEARDPGTGALTRVQTVGAYGTRQTNAIAVSPDDAHVYPFSSSDYPGMYDLGVFARDGGTGMLTFVEAQRAGELDQRGLAITPDGAHLYVACAHRASVVELVRDAGSGAVSVAGVQHDGIAGVDGLQGARAVAVSPDGAHVYVASADEPLHQQSALVAFARDAGSGALSFIEVERAGVGVPSLEAVNSLAVAPDGAHVYAGAYRAITVFARNPATGALDFASAVTEAPGGAELYGVSGVAVSPDGAHLYALTVDRLHVFARDAGTGVLTPVETEQGFADGVSIAISPDGRTVYVGARIDRAVWAFDRNPATGRLVLLHTRLVTRNSFLAIGGVTSVTVSPDGAYVYAAAGGVPSVSSLAIFRRDTVTGRLFLAEERFGPSLGGVRTVVASPDRRHVYAAATADGSSIVDALSVFAPRVACAPMPVTACHAPTVAGRAFVRLTDHPVDDDLNVLKWKWSGGSATTLADFGAPQASTDFALCLYDASGSPQPRLDALAPAGGTCPTKACWKPSAKRIQYWDTGGDARRTPARHAQARGRPSGIDHREGCHGHHSHAASAAHAARSRPNAGQQRRVLGGDLQRAARKRSEPLPGARGLEPRLRSRSASASARRDRAAGAVCPPPRRRRPAGRPLPVAASLPMRVRGRGRSSPVPGRCAHRAGDP